MAIDLVLLHLGKIDHNTAIGELHLRHPVIELLINSFYYVLCVNESEYLALPLYVISPWLDLLDVSLWIKAQKVSPVQAEHTAVSVRLYVVEIFLFVQKDSVFIITAVEKSVYRVVNVG